MFFPKKTKVFENLRCQSTVAKKAAKTFSEITQNWKKLGPNSIELKKLESEADRCVQEVKKEVGSSFVLPFNHADLIRMTELLDDIIDNLEQAANRLSIYGIPKTTEALKGFSKLVSESIGLIDRGLELAEHKKMDSEEYTGLCRKIHTLENEGDKLHRKVLAELMGGKKAGNIRYIIKMREVYQTLEDIMDLCEDYAVLLNMLRITYR